MPRLSVCVVDDNETIRLSLEQFLVHKGHEAFCAATGKEAMALAERESIDIFLLDLMLPDTDGMAVLGHVRKVSVDSAVVMISAHGSVERTVQAMKRGAENFVTKPIDLRRLDALVETIGKRIVAERDATYYRSLRAGTVPFVGVSEHAQKVLQLIDLLAENPDTTVLLSGESGTGKGVVAALIHENSARRSRPWVAVNCAELTPQLLETELFGYERGAFTDAKQRKKGLLEVADGGTLFLDEIGELDLGLQPKLLSVLENRSFRRVGGVRDIRVDIRVISATNVDLQARVQQGRFREDLYYRLKVMPVHLQALRERVDDIEPLVHHFLTAGGRKGRRWGHAPSPEVVSCLKAYAWPGNVRELRNILERATILAKADTIEVEHLPAEVLNSAPSSGLQERAAYPDTELGRAQGASPRVEGQISPESSGPLGGVPRSLEEMERELIEETLVVFDGNRTRAARSLGISRSTLLEKIKRYQG